MFGQLVIGSPGSGKSSWVAAMAQFLTGLGRSVCTLNLDPACDAALPYTPTIDCRTLITVDDAMAAYGLGPNGALLYCLTLLASNTDWLATELSARTEEYLLVDFPGQVELFTGASPATGRLFDWFREWSTGHLCVVHCLDATQLRNEASFMAGALVALTSMCALELPQVNLLTKCDLLDDDDLLDRIEGEDAATIREIIVDSREHDSDSEADESGDTDSGGSTDGASHYDRWSKLTDALCEVLDSYGLVSFLPVSIDSKTLVWRALKAIDASNGFQFAGNATAPSMFNAVRTVDQ